MVLTKFCARISAVQDQLGDEVGWKIYFDAIPGMCRFTSGGAV